MRVALEYRDREGALVGELYTTGTWLEAVIDGQRFTGRDLDGLTPVGDCAPRFALVAGDLADCCLSFTLPITVRVHGEQGSALLRVDVALGPAGDRGGLEHERVRLELMVGDRSVRSSGRSGWFEDELAEIHCLAPDLHLMTCFGCGLSDYSLAGHGLFGWLMCFRGSEEAYRQVRTKQDLFALAARCTELVQETHVCPDFEVRVPGTGYRG